MRIICFKKGCKHLCDMTDECTREITVINVNGECKHFHPIENRSKDEVYS